MPGYVIFQAEVTDPQRYELYREEAAASIEAAGGRYLVRGGEVDVLEGDPPLGRIVVLEFPTRKAALDWYHGAAYSAARKFRDGAARARVFVVESVSP